jgi:hypothetical protein
LLLVRPFSKAQLDRTLASDLQFLVSLLFPFFAFFEGEGKGIMCSSIGLCHLG